MSLCSADTSRRSLSGYSPPREIPCEPGCWRRTRPDASSPLRRWDSWLPPAARPSTSWTGSSATPTSCWAGSRTPLAETGRLRRGGTGPGTSSDGRSADQAAERDQRGQIIIRHARGPRWTARQDEVAALGARVPDRDLGRLRQVQPALREDRPPFTDRA